MSFARRYCAELKRQASARTESRPIRRVRYHLAALSVMIGFVGATYPIRDSLRGWLIPGWTLMVLGMIAGIGVWIFRNPFRSRKCGTVAFIATALGIICFVLGR